MKNVHKLSTLALIILIWAGCKDEAPEPNNTTVKETVTNTVDGTVCYITSSEIDYTNPDITDSKTTYSYNGQVATSTTVGSNQKTVTTYNKYGKATLTQTYDEDGALIYEIRTTYECR